MYNVKFLFDYQLVAALEKLIKEANGELLLISPFIDLDKRIQRALNEKKNLHDFKLKILFGKNEKNIYKSVKKDSFKVLKEFPNIEIRYNSKLHAKFYQSDTKFIMTSMNLYDYSLANNIEVGIEHQYAEKGKILKAVEGIVNNIGEGIDNVKEEYLWKERVVNPIDEFLKVYNESEVKYQTEPIIGDKKSLSGLFGAKELIGKKVLIDTLQVEQSTKKGNINSDQTITKPKIKVVGSNSAKKIAESKGVTQNVIIELMEKAGYVKDKNITALGKDNGLKMKSFMGNEYIAYPINLKEFQDI